MRHDEWKVPVYSLIIITVVLGSCALLSEATMYNRPNPNHKLRLLS